jgi:cell division protease FtsH
MVPMPINQKHTWNLSYWFIAALMLLTLQDLWQSAREVEAVPYSAFEQALADGKIAEVQVTDRQLTGKLKTPKAASCCW